MAGNRDICVAAAQLIVKYDINCGKLVLVLPSRHVVDPTNRDKVFAFFDDILNLGHGVAGLGYVKDYARSICTQLPQDKNEMDVIIRYNSSKHEADPRLPAVDTVNADLSGSAGNTMFLFMRCVKQGSKAPGSFLANADGNLDLEVLRKVSPNFAHHVEVGVPTTILSRDIRTEEPMGLQLIQAAENARCGVQRVENHVQVVRRLCSLIADSLIFETEGVDGVVKIVKRQVPHLEDDVVGLTKWALIMGGDTSQHVAKFATGYEKHIPGKRKLKGDMWEALAITIPPEYSAIRGAVTLMCYSCPTNKVINGYCQWLMPSELKALLTGDDNKKKFADADKFIRQWDARLEDDVALPEHVREAIGYRLEQRTARLTTKRKHEALVEYADLLAIANAANKELEARSIISEYSNQLLLKARFIAFGASSRTSILILFGAFAH